MKRLSLVAIATLCVASCGFLSTPLQGVYAEEAAASTDGSAASDAPTEIKKPTHDPDCVDTGFDFEALDCRLCDMLALLFKMKGETNALNSSATTLSPEEEEKKHQEVVDKCKRCCTDVAALEAEAKKRTYARVVLEVDKRRLGQAPKVASFMEKNEKTLTRFQVEDIENRSPYLVFYDENDEKQEEVNIATWNDDVILEFIESKLKKIDEPADSEAAKDKDEKDTKGDGSETSESDATAEDVVEVEISAGGE